MVPDSSELPNIDKKDPECGTVAGNSIMSPEFIICPLTMKLSATWTGPLIIQPSKVPDSKLPLISDRLSVV